MSDPIFYQYIIIRGYKIGDLEMFVPGNSDFVLPTQFTGNVRQQPGQLEFLT